MLIAFAGRKGSGKSTAAYHLVKRWGFEEIGLADPMKRFLSTEFGVPDDYLTYRKEESCPYLCGRSVRHALQTLGTEWGRNLIGPIWINRFQEAAISNMKNGTSVVCADIRFRDEIDLIHRLHGFVIWVAREGAGVTDGHISENAITPINCDEIVYNHGSIFDLNFAIEQAIWPPIEQPMVPRDLSIPPVPVPPVPSNEPEVPF